MRVRSSYNVAGVALLVLSLVALAYGVIGFQRFGGWPLLIACSLFLLSLVAFVAGAVFSPLSERGAELRAQWQGFSATLRNITRGREPAYDPHTFERYLPYAASFGMAESWAKALSKQASAEIPVWFVALAGAKDGGMGAFVAMAAVSHSTGSSGAGGAAGAGGGGGSGVGEAEGP